MMHIAGLAGLCVAGLLQAGTVQAPAEAADDPRIRAVVEAFFRAQEAEDADTYLALWSEQARKPTREQLDYIFKSGDDRFTGIAIRRVVPVGDLRRVQVSVMRERTSNPSAPGGKPRVTGSVREWSLTLTPEGGELKILSEGFPADELATAILAARTPEELDALLDADPTLLNTRLLSAMTSRADGLAQTQKFAAARQVYERVLEVARRAGLRKQQGEALQSIANSYYFERNLPRALEFYEERLALERQEEHEAGIAGALQGIATIKYSSFEYSDALAAYQEALAIYEKLDDDVGMASALLSTGNVLYLQGVYEAAIADYTRSRALYKQLYDTEGEARALAGLGRVYMSQGDYAGALAAFAGVIEDSRARNNRITQANALHSTGEVHLRLGNAGAARAAFAESRGHFEAANDPAAIGVSWQGTALAELLAARYQQAEAAYAESMKACTVAEDQDCVARAIVGLAFAQYSQDRFDHAVASYRKAIDAFGALKKLDEVGRAEVGLSQALFGRGDFQAAAAAAVSARDRTAAYDVVWRALLAEARAQRALKAPEAAMTAVAAAVKIVDEMARVSLEQPTKRMSPDAASAHIFYALVQAEAGDPAAAFESVERGQAYALRVALAPHDREIARGMTAEEREAERLAMARLGSLDAQLEKEEALPKPNNQRIMQLRQQRDAAAAERLLQRERLFDARPDLRIWRGLAPPVSRAEIESFVATDGAPVVQLVIDQDALLAVVAAPGEEEGSVRFSASASPIQRRTLAELVAAAIQPDSLRDSNEWLTRSAPLAAALPAAGRDALMTSARATLILDDVLWRVPFEALPIEEGYLASSVEIAYAASVTAMVRSKEAAPSSSDEPPAGAVAIAAAPVLPAERVARVATTAPDWSLRDPDAALREAGAVAARYEEQAAHQHTFAAATEAAIRVGLSESRRTHIAAPFRINSASPLFSPILLADPPVPVPATDASPEQTPPPPPPKAPEDDGVLELREVPNLEARADVVVLSDGSALSMRDAASVLPVVRWAWRAAGVEALMLRRWTDDHPSADALLADFHARTIDGADATAALQAARAVHRGDPPRAPWFWASWMVLR